MNLLLLLSDNSLKISDVHKLDLNNFDVIKLDEKTLASPKEIKKLINKTKYNKIYFACSELRFQRFIIFMKLYILFFGSCNGSVIDALGNTDNFSLYKLLFKEIPLLGLELILSGLIVPYFYIKLPILKWLNKQR